MRKSFRPLLVLAMLAGVAAPALAGTAQVNFVNPESFSDAGRTTGDEHEALIAISRHLQALARERLPDGQTLQVDVLDVQRVGTPRPRPGRDWTRIARNRADIPRLHLRFRLEDGGQVVRSGDEWLSDLDYAGGLRGDTRRNQPFYYETRMLDRWFAERFGAPQHG